VSYARTVLLALAPILLHALAREADRALGLVLRAQVSPSGLLAEVGRAAAFDAAGAAGRVALWLVAGAAVWLGLSGWRRRREGTGWAGALEGEVRTFGPLYLRPALSLLALLAVALRPQHPYGFTLPVALTQDWAIGQDAAALATVVALRGRPLRLGAPGGGAVFLIAFLAYALLAPEWAWHWDSHPGNEPKYLRMAVAIGHDLTLNAEGVTGPMEELPTTPLPWAAARAARALGRESALMARALLQGPRAVGEDAIRATRITRQTIAGKDGGVYYVLAPGPSIALAPTLRLDRAVNRARGTPGRLAVSVLTWSALAALLVVVLFRLVRDATGSGGLAAILALGFALLPPFTFYSFQFYPEMPGAIVLGVAFHLLALRRETLRKHPWLLGWLVATLPWIHQKFLLVWVVLAATAAVVGFRARPHVEGGARPYLRWLLGLAVPQALSGCLFTLYNFGITGSVRPDAVFIAWGWGLTNERVGQGILGLLLDARYGIVPYVPLFVLAVAGFVLGGARVFAPVVPAAVAYYMTVATADNWAGPVCNLGRFFMPVAPLAVALVGVCLARVASRRGALALALILASWSAVFALLLRQDPIAANDSALLLAKATFADGNQYIPNLFIRTWADGAPGLWARILAWLVAIGLATFWLRRGERARQAGTNAGASPTRTLAATAVLLLATAWLLEGWAGRPGPVFHRSIAVSPDAVLFLDGAAQVREDAAVLGPGRVDLQLRAPQATPALRVLVGGRGLLRVPGLAPVVLRPSGARVSLPLPASHVVRGADGRDVAFSFGQLVVEGGQAVLRPIEDAAGPRAAPQVMEPGEARLR
jgi:hypothetical protein